MQPPIQIRQPLKQTLLGSAEVLQINLTYAGVAGVPCDSVVARKYVHAAALWFAARFSKQAQLSYIILTTPESALGPDAIAGADTLQPLLATLPNFPSHSKTIARMHSGKPEDNSAKQHRKNEYYA